MNALLNGQTLSADLAKAYYNRGFRFGDGCFETMLVQNGTCSLLPLHLARLKKSLPVLGLQWPESLNLEEQLMQVCEGTAGWQRVRLWVWRSGEGIYTPESQEANTMLMASPASAPTLTIKNNVAFSEEVELLSSRWSFIKSISALPYIMAGKEKREKASDELILCSHRGEVAEGTVSNLFWKKRKRWYTPALDTGCVAGVMRAWIMKQLIIKGEPAFEVVAQPDELQKVDKLVCTNVAGLYPISQLEGKSYDTDVEELWSLMPEEY